LSQAIALAGREKGAIRVPTFVCLMRWSAPGLADLPGWRDRLEDGERVIRERGGRLLAVYVTLGRFDLVEIFEAPDDNTAGSIIFALSASTDAVTETLRAYSREEAEEIIRSL
jgi:uncharacterized protein with GYD domain